MATKITAQGCKVETTCIICPNGTYTEDVVLSVDPASTLALAVEESAGRPIPQRGLPRGSSRLRATRHGFVLVAD